MEKKKVLITGASGFIGRNLAEQLSSEHLIYAPSSRELDLLNGEKVERYLIRGRFTEIIHCATHNATVTSTKDLSLVFYNNVRMFFTLARCHRYYNRMFYFGSGADYGIDHYIPKMKEGYFDTYLPKDNYGFSKYIMSKFSGYISNIYDLRLFGCFGKYEDWRIRFISNAICKALYDLDITMRQNVFFDYLYVNDLAQIMKLFLKKDNLQYHHYNVCTGTSIDLKTLAKIVLKVSGKKLAIKVAVSGLKPEYSGDNSRLVREIAHFSFTPIEEALRELYQWYANHKKDIDKNELLIDKHH